MTLVAALDDVARAHLARALAEHRRWCRDNGVTVPAALVDLADTLIRDKGGQERTSRALEPTAVHGASVPLLLTYREVADLLAVSPRTVRRMVADGRLPSVSVADAAPRVRRADLERYVDSLAPSPMRGRLEHKTAPVAAPQIRRGAATGAEPVAAARGTADRGRGDDPRSAA